jgi:hypothetical protein
VARRSDETLMAIAGCESVTLPLRLSFNEMQALKWAYQYLQTLATRGVITVPREHAECFHPAIGAVMDLVIRAEPTAKKLVAARLKELKGEAS